MEDIAMRLDRIEQLVVLNLKQVLNIEEVVKYIGVSKSRVYALCSKREIPHYKMGRHLYFKRTEIDEWLTSSRVTTKQEIQAMAYSHCVKHNIKL